MGSQNKQQLIVEDQGGEQMMNQLETSPAVATAETTTTILDEQQELQAGESNVEQLAQNLIDECLSEALESLEAPLEALASTNGSNTDRFVKQQQQHKLAEEDSDEIEEDDETLGANSEREFYPSVLASSQQQAFNGGDILQDLSEMSAMADRIDFILDQSTPDHSRTSAGSGSPWRGLSPAPADSGQRARTRSPSPRLNFGLASEEEEEEVEIEDDRID